MIDNVNLSGEVAITIDYKNGNKEFILYRNKILRTGRIDIAKTLGNEIGGSFQFFVTAMAFGGEGTIGGVPRVIDDTREGLFGATLLTKGVISRINDDNPTQVSFTSVVTFDELVGETINEMALQLKNGDYFSMVTFGNIVKTSSMQLTLNWYITVI